MCGDITSIFDAPVLFVSGLLFLLLVCCGLIPAFEFSCA